MGILMLDKPLFYLMKTKSLLYTKFVDKFNLGEKEKYVFDLNKFNKIDSLPSKSFIILKEEFMEKNKAEFLNFMNSEKEKLNRIMNPLKSEKNNVESRIKGLNDFRKELKEKICPQCHYRDKSRDKRICPDCAAKNQRYLNGMKQSSPLIHGASTAVGHTAYNLTHSKKYRHYD
jgi:ferredoxin-thioredoxin reductase catalytic subunit